MIYNSDLRIDFLIITELWKYFDILMEFNRIYQSGMIVIYNLHLRSAQDLQRC